MVARALGLGPELGWLPDDTAEAISGTSTHRAVIGGVGSCAEAQEWQLTIPLADPASPRPADCALVRQLRAARNLAPRTSAKREARGGPGSRSAPCFALNFPHPFAL